MLTLLHTIHFVTMTLPHVPLASLLHVLAPAANNPVPPAAPGANNTDIGPITTAVGRIEGDVVGVAGVAAALMITVAGLMIIFDRDVATTKRGERLAFIRSILIGLAIVLGAHFLITLVINVMNAANF